MTEQVLVVKRELLEPFLASGESLITDNIDTIFDKILANHRFVDRRDAEYDYGLKQVIPYVVVRHGGNFLLLKRTPKQTEKRLHNKYSLGIGGHINPSRPGKGSNIIVEGLYRELNEEVLLGSPGELSFRGVINDDSSSVGRVHLGLCYLLEAQSGEFSIKEADKMVGDWMAEEGIIPLYDRMETWSQIVFDHFACRTRDAGPKESR